MATRISRIERRNIAVMAAAQYRNSSRSIHEHWPEQGHAAFDGTYAESITLKMAELALGMRRTNGLSGDNFNSLVREAKAKHQEYVDIGIVTEQGLATEKAERDDNTDPVSGAKDPIFASADWWRV